MFLLSFINPHSQHYESPEVFKQAWTWKYLHVSHTHHKMRTPLTPFRGREHTWRFEVPSKNILVIFSWGIIPPEPPEGDYT